jgi:hypothetical protein
MIVVVSGADFKDGVTGLKFCHKEAWVRFTGKSSLFEASGRKVGKS